MGSICVADHFFVPSHVFVSPPIFMCNDKVILEKVLGQLLILYNVGLVKKKMGEQLGECWDEKGVKKNIKK